MNKKQTIDFDMNVPYSERYEYYTAGEVVQVGVDALVQHCHAASYNRGWWHDPITGMSLIPTEVGVDPELIGADQFTIMRTAWFPYVIATKIALIHSEISEGLEAYRTDAGDDKIAFPGITAEMADAVIRIADLMGCLKYAAENGITIDGWVVDGEIVLSKDRTAYDLGAAIMAKLPVNAGRADHDLAKRKLPGGKKF